MDYEEHGEPYKTEVDDMENEKPTYPEVYDPRVGKKVVSNNPALLLAMLFEARLLLLTEKQEKDFWKQIGKMADWLEEEVPHKSDFAEEDLK